MQNPQGHAKPRTSNLTQREPVRLSRRYLVSNAKLTIGRAAVCAVHVGQRFPRGTKQSPLPPSSGPATVKSGGASSSSVASSGLSLRRCGKRGSRPGRTQDRRESRQDPESRQVRNSSCNVRSQRPSPRGSATPCSWTNSGTISEIPASLVPG